MQPSSRELLQRHLALLEEQIRSLERQHRGVVAAALNANADDEHDPEGSTLAFERQQATAMLEHARRSRLETLKAMDRLATGNYGTCTECGSAIGDERLAARPHAPTCIRCAGNVRR